MKKKLNIISNNNIRIFLKKFLSKYELIFLKLEEIDYKEQSTKANIIIINNNKDSNKINFESLNTNYLIFSNLTNKKLNLNNSLQLLNTPTSINNIKNKIENFVQNLKIYIYDISINNEKLTNIKNNSFCYLTKVELEILTCLVREKETSKKFIRENILKIKSNIETNSLESHLTRIRKKLNLIRTVVKIQTRNEKLLITT
tara:strand:- start:1048 stop:1650 length:603 start_codon:yes stop_codon:yes gene_type:complete